MKPLCLLIMFLGLNAQDAKAQPTCGIYSTAFDFRTKQISIPTDCHLGKKAIQVSDFFLRPYVYIRTEQGKSKIHEDSIYAIQNCDGSIYRVWNKKLYQLLDSGKLQIYQHTYDETVKVRTLRSYRYEKKQAVDYYFSINDTATIMPLSLVNVRLALLADNKLDKELLHNFPNDSSLKMKKGKHFEINNLISDNPNNNSKNE